MMMSFRSFTFVLLAALGSSANAGSLRSHEDGVMLKEHMPLFRAWSQQFDKKYESADIFMDRLKVWVDNHGKCFKWEKEE